jgi:hypothetical protein
MDSGILMKWHVGAKLSWFSYEKEIRCEFILQLIIEHRHIPDKKMNNGEILKHAKIFILGSLESLWREMARYNSLTGTTSFEGFKAWYHDHCITRELCNSHWNPNKIKIYLLDIIKHDLNKVWNNREKLCLFISFKSRNSISLSTVNLELLVQALLPLHLWCMSGT